MHVQNLKNQGPLIKAVGTKTISEELDKFMKRIDAEMRQLSNEIASINAIIGRIVQQSRACEHEELVVRLSQSIGRLLNAEHTIYETS